MALVPHVVAEAKGKLKKKPRRAKNGLYIEEYDGNDPITFIQYDPKTGQEKYYKYTIGGEREEYNGFEELTWTEWDPDSGTQRHYRGTFRERGAGRESGNDNRRTSEEGSGGPKEESHSRNRPIQEDQAINRRYASQLRSQNYRQPQEEMRPIAASSCICEAIITLRQELETLRPQIAAAAQEIYDAWDQVDGLDMDLGGGGICDQISAEISGIVANNIDASIDEYGHDGDDHASVVVSRAGEQYVVDINFRHYESGGGYSWRKIPDVVFTPEMVDILPL
jgi:hypothetical protein